MRLRELGSGTSVALAVTLLLGVTSCGRGDLTSFLSSLRLAKPKPVTVAVPGFSGPTATRRLQEAVGGMVADTVSVVVDEKDQAAPNSAAASRLAGFEVQLPRLRTDSPTFIVVGAHAVTMTVDRSQLLKVLSEAGRSSIAVPAAVDGGRVTMRTPRAIRVQYGRCPVPVANTLQGQIQGPPPPSTDNGDCVVLIESPLTAVSVPPGIDIQQLVDLGLELSGMSPDQTNAFRQRFSSQASLSMAIPRFMRSYDSVTVNGERAMLLNTAGRRGPTYDLLWTRNDIVYSLAGYGSSADAVPLANSTQ
jgi:hypothetical protein